MTDPPPPQHPQTQREMLHQGISRARKLVEGLERDARELTAARPRANLSADALAEGRAAVENALAAARRLLVALEAAVAIEPTEGAPDESC